jgi:hypothetical protein
MATTPATTPAPFLRRRTWIVLILNAILMSIGCNPNTLAMLVAPWADDKEPPEYKIIESAKKEVTVVVMASAGDEIDRRGLPQVENDVADMVGEHMRLRCRGNKEKIKIVPTAQVRNFQNKQGLASVVRPAEVGKHFKADYVVYLDITAMSLYEKHSHGLLYRGVAEIEVNLYDMKKQEGGGECKVFNKPYRCEYPNIGGRDTSDCSQTQFKSLFLARIARDVSKMFIAYPSDERMAME